MHPWLPRALALLLGFLVLTVLDAAGVQISTEERERLLSWLNTGLTGAGGLTLLLSYAVGHRVLSRYFNPADVAQQPKDIAEPEVHSVPRVIERRPPPGAA
jgi:hypothetical protein